MILLFFLLDMTYLVLMVSNFTESLAVQKAAGGVGLATSAVAFYAGASRLLTEETTWFTLPVGPIRKHPRD